MVLCGTNAEGKTELVTPPEATAVGARITVEGFSGEADPQLNPRKKVFETVSADFAVTSEGVAAYKGVPFTSPDGPCVLPTIRDGIIK